jgi:ring-1,2-phenylacetyl-CoA epoxidase subunit PaaD
MVVQQYTKEAILKMLSVIADPEIPVVTIEEMGMLKDVNISSSGVEVLLTPTYTGCPAMNIIEQDIKMTLAANGVEHVTVKLVYDPAWTTDWMTDTAKAKMKQYGIAPPLTSSCNSDRFTDNVIECPHCGSKETQMVSRFGSTACKSLFTCKTCLEPFEYFKCH